jgi:hypothetical protein
MREGFIKEPPMELLEQALKTAVEAVKAEG